MKVNNNLHILKSREEPNDFVWKQYRKKWDEQPTAYEYGEFPLFLDIEATPACNLKCPACASLSNRKKGFMEFDLFERIIDEASEKGCFGCKFHTASRGEPLLHNKLPEMVAYAKKKGLIDVYLNTNGLLLGERLGRKLLDAGLDRLVFSVDGYTKEYYEKKRPGSNFERVVQNIDVLYRIKQRGKYPTSISIQTIDFGDIDLEKYKEYWEVSCDEVRYLTLQKLGKKNVKNDWSCQQLWQRLGIQYNGAVSACNLDIKGQLVLGNVKKTALSKIWRSSELCYIRDGHKKGEAHLLGACNSCQLRSSEIGG